MTAPAQPPVVQPDAARVIAQLIPRPSTWQRGPDVAWEWEDPPWRPTMHELATTAIVERQEIVMQPQARLSAVLVLLAERERGVEVLLTRRSLAMNNHAGEVSFPGGRVDPDESAHEAALREAHEEVGLVPTDVTVRGELEHLNTIVSKSYIIPVVATIDAATLARTNIAPMTMEVDRVLWTPIADLVAPRAHHTERWMRPDQAADIAEATLHFFDTPTDVVWGATARILVDLFDRAWTARPGGPPRPPEQAPRAPVLDVG